MPKGLEDIAQLRLITQHLRDGGQSTVMELVSRMGAMQAQDFAMAKWAVGIRIPGSNEKTVEDSYNKGEILRTHLMRPTWHLVSSDDIRWLIALTAPHIKRSMGARHRQLEISGEILKSSNRLIINALKGGNHLPRETLVQMFRSNGIKTNDNRASHLLLCAELDGIICSGPIQGRNTTFALLDERVPQGKPLSKAEALARLARKYFSSHGPATLHDFTWWSGLPVADAREALEMIKTDFRGEKRGEFLYWMPASLHKTNQGETSVFLLPAYDEFIISYRDRSASFIKGTMAKAVSSNGIFRPVILVNGQVMGLWRRISGKSIVEIETQFFTKSVRSNSILVDSAIQSYRSFSGR